jgi:hypothetical protein
MHNIYSSLFGRVYKPSYEATYTVVFFMFLVACLEESFTEKDTFW